MGKIIYLMGKSSSGKDTIFRELIKRNKIGFRTIVPYTTRPIRVGETQGQEYFFTDEEGFLRLQSEGRVIEHRAYHTYHGIWRYFTVDDGQVDLSQCSYIIIGTLESYLSTGEYFGQDKMIPVLIELDDGIRLQRALNRERKQKNPKYEEMCRRYLADSQDFAEEKIKAAGIETRFYNDNLEKVLEEIEAYIVKQL